ncbi:MAG: GMC family oxidoreductase [Thiobacillaceae bacterium]
MILDARDENTDLNRAARFVIVGAGPAGMTLARKLADVGPVLLIESGGFEVDAGIQALNEGESVGIPYSLTETRARGFGGTSSLWAGWCAVFDSLDFLPRDWVPGSGWPFGADAIEPYYAETARILNLGEPNFDARDITEKSGTSLPFDTDLIVPSVWRFGTPTMEFGRHLREEFASSAEVIALTHANVVDIRLDADHSRARELVIRTLKGREGRVSGDVVVLACGGIETPRLLLNADTQVPHGLGNANDLVGRFFQEHPHQRVNSLILKDAAWFKSSLRRAIYDRDRQFMLAMGLSPDAQAAAKVLNARAHVYRTPDMGDETPRLGLFLEQAPNSESRVMLTERRDFVGMRRVRLDWQLMELDWKTSETTGQLLVREFEKSDSGQACVPNRAPARDNKSVMHTSHHIGTTRMAENREAGVVDPNCRVHDLENLYIAGSSVFPTGSWANPTFTLIALALRLADHLQIECGPAKRSV